MSQLSCPVPSPTAEPIPSATFGWTLLLGLAVTALCFVLDRPVYDFLHQHAYFYRDDQPAYLKLPHKLCRSMESWGEGVQIVAIVLAAWCMDQRRRGRLLCLSIALIVSTSAIETVKRLTSRERPVYSQGQTHWHGVTHWSKGGDYQSFPSGHTGAAGVYSGWLAAMYPPLRPVAVMFTVGCGCNRIWKERHFLSDCWVAGFFSFWLTHQLTRRRWPRRLVDRLDRWSTPRELAASTTHCESVVHRPIPRRRLTPASEVVMTTNDE